MAARVVSCHKILPVKLEFKHITSQITVSAEPKDKAEKLTYKVNSIKMEAPSTGTYSMNLNTDLPDLPPAYWSINKDLTSEYVFVDNIKAFNQSGNYTNNEVYWNILPTTSGSLKFTVDYQVYADNRLVADYTGKNCKICTVENPSLVEGKKYNYNLVLPHNLDPMSFTYSIEEWNDGENNSNEVSAETRAESTFVDLGLPSGVKWATGNVGAEKETDGGSSVWYDNYNKKNVFDYCYYRGQDAQKDIVTGRIPTKTEFQELVNNCNIQHIDNYNTKEGLLFTSKINGNSIFFPLCTYYEPGMGTMIMENHLYLITEGEYKFDYHLTSNSFSFSGVTQYDLNQNLAYCYYPARAVTK